MIQKTNIQQTLLIQYALIWGAQPWCFSLELTVVFFSLHPVDYSVTISSLLSIICWNWPAHTVLMSVTEAVHYFFTSQWLTGGPLFWILVVQEFVAFRLASQLYILFCWLQHARNSCASFLCAPVFKVKDCVHWWGGHWLSPSCADRLFIWQLQLGMSTVRST